MFTEDGSHTLYVPDLNEHFHSTFGAIQESQHIFIDAGLVPLLHKKEEIHILEIGFGTGLNALLTYLLCNKENQKVHYTSIEAFPVEEEIYRKLNFGSLINHKNASEVFLQLHSTPWNLESSLDEKFILKKSHTRLEDVILPESHFDLVYFDAFAPDIQPELWAEKEFKKLYKALKTQGVLVTYSCKGNVKRTLKAVGFTIEKLPGPKGKREFLRAYKQ